MAIIKCKMCGGDLNVLAGESVCECEYCGSRQTVPNQDDEKKLILFERANRLRYNCEFDKAAGLYESIIADFRTESEAYWGLVLCKYGIEYVDDPATGKKIPTCHRSSFESVMDDPNLEQALENADVLARKVYREESKQIEELRKGIIEVSSKEEPYDIFICYKETDENGDRTLDSVLAQDIYDALTAKDYRVFFARITLEDKLGRAYEPYIFAALNSARIMLAVGTDYEYYNAVWVKNEWSRFLQLMASDKSKHLIPCYKGIGAYDMPKEFAKLQAQDLGKVGAMQDLLRGIEKIMPKQAETVRETVVVQQSSGPAAPGVESFLKRAFMFLEDSNWKEANAYAEKVLDIDPENARAYLVKLMDERRITLQQNFLKLPEPFDNDPLYKKVIRYADPALKKQMEDYNAQIRQRNENARMEKIYCEGMGKMQAARSADSEDVRAEQDYKDAARIFKTIPSYKDAAALADICKEDALKCVYTIGKNMLEKAKDSEQCYNAAALLKRVQGYLDADVLYKEAMEKHKRLQQEESYKKGRLYMGQNRITGYQLAEAEFAKIPGYLDADALRRQCQEKRSELTKQLKEEREERHRRKREVKEAYEAAQREAARRERSAALIKGLLGVGAAMAVVVFLIVLFTAIIPGNRYKEAAGLFEAGNYSEAFDGFMKSKNYKDSMEQAYLCADALYTGGEYALAAEKFKALGDHQDSKARMEASLQAHAEKLEAEVLNNAENLESSASSKQDFVEAAKLFAQLDGEENQRKVVQLWGYVTNSRYTIDGGNGFVVAVAPDGTMLSYGDNDKGQCDVSGWTDIVAVAAGEYHTVGLKADGTVLATGENEDGQCEVSDWTGIVAVAAGEVHTLGLRYDGTVLITGADYFSMKKRIPEWEGFIVDIAASDNQSVALTLEGGVRCAGMNGLNWGSKKQLALGDDNFFLGLNADGTVDAQGHNVFTSCDIELWTDIKAIGASYNCNLGLTNDGRVRIDDRFLGDKEGEEGWTDIIALSVGRYDVFGIKADGSVVHRGLGLLGNNEPIPEIQSWTIKLP